MAHSVSTTRALDSLMEIEIFRPHPEYPNFNVSSWGNVFNAKTMREVGYLSGPRGGDRNSNPNAYVRVCVSNTPKRTKALSVMILETFVGPCPEGHEGDHIDHNSLNNRLDNLRWLPSEDNQRRKIRR